MRTEKTREWAFGNHGAGQRNRRWKDGLLTQGEVQWIMDEEDNATLLIKNCTATGGQSPRGLIRQAVGEFFVCRARRCCCSALIRIYKSSDIFVPKEQHPVSGSDGAVVLQNAKR